MATQTTNRSPLTQALKSCYPALGATFILSMFINATMLASPLYSMQVYDRVLTSRNVSTLVMLTLIVALFLVLYGVLEFTRSGVLARAGVQFESSLRRPLFETMMKAELSPQHRLVVALDGDLAVRHGGAIERGHRGPDAEAAEHQRDGDEAEAGVGAVIIQSGRYGELVLSIQCSGGHGCPP